MASQRITQLTQLDGFLNGDLIPVVRGGANYAITPDQFSIDPHAFGAKGDAVGGHDATVSGIGNNELASGAYTFTAADVGKLLWVNNGTERTIVGVIDGKAIFSPGLGFSTSNDLWLAGTDDTVALQAALDFARDLQGPDTAETSGATNMLIRMGGVVRLRMGRAYIVSNSQANFNAGKVAALVVYRRTSLIGAGVSAHQSAICLKPGSYGDIISNFNPSGTSYSDFITLANFTAYGYDGWNPNGRYGINLWVAFDGYDNIDPFNRITNVTVRRTKNSCLRAQGRGEFICDGFLAAYAAGHGIHLLGLNDYRIMNTNSLGNVKSGLLVDRSTAGHIIDSKFFYNGAGGGSNPDECSNITLIGDRFEAMNHFANVECQESRGSSIVIRTGLNKFTNCHFYDPGRAALAAGTLPAAVTGIHLIGANCRYNSFSNCTVTPSLTLYNQDQSVNWGNAQSAVHIEGYTEANGGPQENRGNIYTLTPSRNVGGSLYQGTNYPSGAKITGGGVTNGRNPLLRIDNVALAAAAPGRVYELTAVAGNNSVFLNWEAAFWGGSTVTDYRVEYKESSSGTWLLFSDGVSSDTNTIVTGLTGGTAYDFRVSAINAIGTGTASATATATPFSIAAIPQLRVWLDSTSNVSATGDDVDSWTDKSSNAYVFTAAGAVRPKTGTATLNGFNVVSFDNVDDKMSCTIASGLTSGSTIFFVLNTADVAYIPIHAPSKFAFVAQQFNTTTTISAGSGTPTYRKNGTSISFADRNAAYNAFYTGTNILVIENVDLSTWGEISLGNYGDFFYSNFPHAEILIFDSGLSTENKNIIGNYLKARWNAATWTDIA